MAHRIIWSRTSQRDLRSLVTYISKDSPQRAQHFGYRIVANVEMLHEHPLMGRIVPEFHQQNLHEIIVPPYRIIYRINAESELIEVIRIWHAARDTPEIE
jgi:toxin ParE1/3/4